MRIRNARQPGCLIARAALLLALLGAPYGIAAAQSASSSTAAHSLLDSLRPAIERALTTADWPSLESAIQRLRAESTASTGRADPWIQYDLAYALHRRASAMIVEDRAKDARALLEESQAAAARAGSLGAGAHAAALEGAVTGQLAGVSGTFAAMRLGPRAFRLLDEAVAAAPSDPRAALLNGISRLNAPRVFGGGAAKGEPELRRALRLFENDPNQSPRPTWGRVDAHLWLGIALAKLDRPDDARQEFARALALAPGHRWITDELLPALPAPR